MAALGLERATWRWPCERSALGDLLGTDFETVSLMRPLPSDVLMSHRRVIEDYLFEKVIDLFCWCGPSAGGFGSMVRPRAGQTLQNDMRPRGCHTPVTAQQVTGTDSCGQERSKKMSEQGNRGSCKTVGMTGFFALSGLILV